MTEEPRRLLRPQLPFVRVGAKLSWILPLLAWASQAAAVMLLAPWRAPAEVFFLLMVFQGLAILGGLLLGIAALVCMWVRKNWLGRGHAIAGCVISGITIAINVLAFVALVLSARG